MLHLIVDLPKTHETLAFEIILSESVFVHHIDL